MGKLLFVASIVFAVIGGSASVVRAAVPSNDDIGAANAFTVRVQSTTGTAFGPGPATTEGTVTAYDRNGTAVSAPFGQRVQLTPSHG